MYSLLESIKADHKHLTFNAGDCFVWKPQSSTISYDANQVGHKKGLWSLLHEIGHALLNHQTYRDDFELLIMEVQAWDKAKEIALKYNINIDEGHIEECIESYRSWLHRRSKCISCKTVSLQIDRTTYQCHNCQDVWQVPESKMSHIRKSRLTATI